MNTKERKLKSRYVRNARISNHYYGNVFCEKCGSRLAVIESRDYEYLFLVIMCNCGAEVIYQYPENRKPGEDLYIDIGDGPTVCRSCGKKLFYVDERKVRKYAFHIVCGCGREYNKGLRKERPKRRLW